MSQPALLPVSRPWCVRPWCVRLAVGLVLLGLISNALYLWHNCPLNLSEDESHYWEWARHLDYGYYSKPPGIAWTIAAALRVGRLLHLTGDGSGAALMPVVRMPAILFGCLSGLLSLFLARRMFRDDRAALAVIALSAAVPMFAVGSLLITIDSPMYLCWAATVYCLWRAVEAPGPRWMYLAGLACAAGMLFKPVLIALPLCALVGAWGDPAMRRAFKSWHSAGAIGLVLLSQVPFVVWNARHGWVTFKHIGSQGGLVGPGEAHKSWLAPLQRMVSFLGGQAGGMGGLLFVLLVIAVVLAWRWQRRAAESEALRWRFLLAFSVPLWGFYCVMNLWKGTEVNWPAASYFAGMVLLAGVVVRQWPTHRGWRRWTIATVVWGFLLTMAALNLQRAYPFVARKLAPLAGTPDYDKSRWFPGKWDPASKKLRGLAERGGVVGSEAAAFELAAGQPPLIVSGRYDLSSSLAFYLPGHPFVYCVMSQVGGRRSQYDLWPGLNERSADGRLVNAGKPVLLVGNFDQAAFEQVIRPAFARIDPPVVGQIVVDGVLLRTVTMRRAWGFRGLAGTQGDVY